MHDVCESKPGRWFRNRRRWKRARERRALLESAHGKLLEIRERFPDQPVRLNLYLGGKRVSLSPEDVAAMVAAAPLVDLEVGKLREAIGRQLSPTATDENGWTDLHWAAALNLPELARALLDNGADINAPLKDDKEPISDRLKRSLRGLGLDPTFTRRGYTPLHVAALANAPGGCGGVGFRRRERSRKEPIPRHAASLRRLEECPGGHGGVDWRRRPRSREGRTRLDAASPRCRWKCP